MRDPDQFLRVNEADGILSDTDIDGPFADFGTDSVSDEERLLLDQLNHKYAFFSQEQLRQVIVGTKDPQKRNMLEIIYCTRETLAEWYSRENGSVEEMPSPPRSAAIPSSDTRDQPPAFLHEETEGSYIV